MDLKNLYEEFHRVKNGSDEEVIEWWNKVCVQMAEYMYETNDLVGVSKFFKDSGLHERVKSIHERGVI